ncbi:unnamed protein product, partial [Choristocarpus tenellus]
MRDPLRTSLQQLSLSPETIAEVMTAMDNFVSNPDTHPIEDRLERLCESEYTRGAIHALVNYIIACEAGQHKSKLVPSALSPTSACSPLRTGLPLNSKHSILTNPSSKNQVAEERAQVNEFDAIGEMGRNMADKLSMLLKKVTRARNMPSPIHEQRSTETDFHSLKCSGGNDQLPRLNINLKGSLQQDLYEDCQHGPSGPGETKKDEQSLPKRAPVRTGHWKLGHEIGKGSFGTVHIGLNEDSGDLIAVKVLSSHRADMADALYREIDLMRHLSHPHIVCYLGAEVNDIEKTISIFQEWVPGSVTSLLVNFGPFSDQRIASYTEQILHGLVYLHKKRVIHRDIKGGNILIDDRGVVKLCDFGASKMLDMESFLGMGDHTRVGSPLFMAPEILLQKEYGSQVDIWSLGGAVLEMTTGKPPWHTLNLRTPVALKNWVKQNTDPPPLPESISNDLRNFLLRCFVRDPAKRATAKELLSDPFITVQNSKKLRSPASDDSSANSVSDIESLTKTAAIARIRRASHSDVSYRSLASTVASDATSRSPLVAPGSSRLSGEGGAGGGGGGNPKSRGG